MRRSVRGVPFFSLVGLAVLNVTPDAGIRLGVDGTRSPAGGWSCGGVPPHEEQVGGGKGNRDGGRLGGKAGEELAGVAAE